MSDHSPKKPRIAPDCGSDCGSVGDSAAARALAEAEARRAAAADPARPAELGGRNGPEPTRYGDWEKGGLAVDF